MRHKFSTLVPRTMAALTALCLAIPPAFAAPPATHTPVLVELFTSEGCSSCPPADALLARLLRDQPVAAADIIVLEEHVDYWEGLGWHDRFASRAFTDRQSAYARRMNLTSNYTPQMVVDGSDEFVGNDQSQALHSIARAAARPSIALTVTDVTPGNGRISGHIASPVSLPSGTDLYAALVETMASTEVRGGENGGRTLHHVSVVRTLQKLASVRSGSPAAFTLTPPPQTALSALRLVVFAQRAGQGAVLGAATLAIPPAAEQATR